MTTSEPFTPRAPDPDKAPRPRTHHQPPAEKPNKPMLIPKPKACVPVAAGLSLGRSQRLPEMTDGTAMPNTGRYKPPSLAKVIRGLCTLPSDLCRREL